MEPHRSRGLAFAVVLWTRAGDRHRRITRALLDDRPDALPGAGLLLLLLLLLTVFVIACGVVAAVVIAVPRLI